MPLSINGRVIACQLKCAQVYTKVAHCDSKIISDFSTANIHTRWTRGRNWCQWVPKKEPFWTAILITLLISKAGCMFLTFQRPRLQNQGKKKDGAGHRRLGVARSESSRTKHRRSTQLSSQEKAAAGRVIACPGRI